MKIKRLLVAGLFSAFIAPYSFSNIIVNYVSTTTVIGSPSYYRYDFNFQIPAGDVLNGSDSTYLTIYDIPQEPYSLSSSDLLWDIGYQLVGVTPSNLAPTDSSTLYNVTLTYQGTMHELLADLDLGFSIYLLTDQWSLDAFTYVWQDYRKQFDRVQLRNGLVVIEDGEATENNSYNVPAPATIALFGLGLVSLGWSRRNKTFSTSTGV